MQQLYCTAALLLTVTAAVADYKPTDKGKLTVETAADVVLKDEKRKKDLHVKVNFPKEDGKYPVVVFSHGFGAGKEAFAAVSEHWASHGYVVIHPQHADGGRLGGSTRPGLGNKDEADEDKKDDSKPKFDPAKLRERLNGATKGSEKADGIDKLANLQNNPKSITDRVRDVTFIMDSFAELEKQVPELKGKLDADRIGVSGHSYGAAVAVLVGGATADLGDEKGKSLGDKRVKCVLPFSAAGAGEYGLTAGSWKPMTLPVMYVTGTKDIRPGKEFEWRKEAYDGSPAGDKYLVVLDGATHFNFGGGPPGGGRLQRTGDKYSPLVKACSTAFLDLNLKGDTAAKDYLKKDGGFATFASKAVEFNTK
jgi:predicted dienelactone hydrolase